MATKTEISTEEWDLENCMFKMVYNAQQTHIYWTKLTMWPVGSDYYTFNPEEHTASSKSNKLRILHI